MKDELLEVGKTLIINSLLAIQKRNRLEKKVITSNTINWDEHVQNCQFEAILCAAKEIFEGIDYRELEKLVDLERLALVSNELLASIYYKNQREIIETIDDK